MNLLLILFRFFGRRKKLKKIARIFEDEGCRARVDKERRDISLDLMRSIIDLETNAWLATLTRAWEWLLPAVEDF